MEKLSNILKGLCLAGCLLPCLFAAPEVQAATDPASTTTGQAVLFSKREKLKQACSQFEEATGCKVLVTSSIDAEYSDESLESAIMAIFKGLARRAAAHQNAISINVVWKGTATYSNSIAVGVDNVTKGVFAEDALREFRDTLQRYQEAMASIEETKVHEKITKALERLQGGRGGYALEETAKPTQDTAAVENEQTKALRNKLIAELVRNIETKINLARYTGDDRKYLEGAIQNVDYIHENTKFASPNSSASGWYNGQLNVAYTGNETEDDLKITIFHEYLHHINYLLKIHEYRYADVAARTIYEIIDNCFELREETMQDVYEVFLYSLGSRYGTEYWPTKYADLTDQQKSEVLAYKNNNYQAGTCFSGKYRPSNYYRDEINVYEICLKLDKVLFSMSEQKKANYGRNIADYEEIKQKCINYEKRTNINETGYEK
jgi:hypothetical protein